MVRLISWLLRRIITESDTKVTGERGREEEKILKTNSEQEGHNESSGINQQSIDTLCRCTTLCCCTWCSRCLRAPISLDNSSRDRRRRGTRLRIHIETPKFLRSQTNIESHSFAITVLRNSSGKDIGLFLDRWAQWTLFEAVPSVI